MSTGHSREPFDAVVASTASVASQPPASVQDWELFLRREAFPDLQAHRTGVIGFRGPAVSEFIAAMVGPSRRLLRGWQWETVAERFDDWSRQLQVAIAAGPQSEPGVDAFEGPAGRLACSSAELMRSDGRAEEAGAAGRVTIDWQLSIFTPEEADVLTSFSSGDAPATRKATSAGRKLVACDSLILVLEPEDLAGGSAVEDAERLARWEILVRQLHRLACARQAAGRAPLRVAVALHRAEQFDPAEGSKFGFPRWGLDALAARRRIQGMEGYRRERDSSRENGRWETAAVLAAGKFPEFHQALAEFFPPNGGAGGNSATARFFAVSSRGIRVDEDATGLDPLLVEEPLQWILDSEGQRRLGGRPDKQAPAATPEPNSHRRRQRPWLAVVLIGLLLTAGAMALLVSWGHYKLLEHAFAREADKGLAASPETLIQNHNRRGTSRMGAVWRTAGLAAPLDRDRLEIARAYELRSSTRSTVRWTAADLRTAADWARQAGADTTSRDYARRAHLLNKAALESGEMRFPEALEFAYLWELPRVEIIEIAGGQLRELVARTTRGASLDADRWCEVHRAIWRQSHDITPWLDEADRAPWLSYTAEALDEAAQVLYTFLARRWEEDPAAAMEASMALLRHDCSRQQATEWKTAIVLAAIGDFAPEEHDEEDEEILGTCGQEDP